MIYKVFMLENDFDAPDYRFIMGTNNGIAILKINKANLSLSLSNETYLTGKVVN